MFYNTNLLKVFFAQYDMLGFNDLKKADQNSTDTYKKVRP